MDEPQPADPAGSQQRADFRIVLVDDDADTTRALSRLLHLFGFAAITECNDAMTAFDCIKKIRPQVVLLDIAMPGIDGYELARRLRQEVDPPPRLVAVTGMVRPEDRAKAFRAGFDAHLPKPISGDELEALLASYVQGT